MTEDNNLPQKRKKKKSAEDKHDTESPKKKNKTEEFTEITFKYLLRDPATTFSAFDKFSETAQQWSQEQGYDIVARYCQSSAECSEIFKVLEAGKRKPGEVAAIFRSLEAILLRIADDLDKFSMVGQNIVQRLLSSQMATIYFTLLMTNKSGHIKVTLKLLTAMVMLGDRSARMILAQFDFNNPVLPPLLNRRDKKDPNDVRTCLLHFMMSFLIIGSDDVIKQLAEQRGFLGSLIPGLHADSIGNIQMVTSTLLHKVVQNPAISKTLKVRLFTESNMRLLGQLYHWTGPSTWQKRSEDDQMEVDDTSKTEDQKIVADSTHQLLVELCSSHKYGINFYDKSLGTSGQNQNHILTSFLTSLTRVTETPLIQELVIKTLRACQDQLCQFLPSMLYTLSPRPSPKWRASMAFLCKIFEKQSEPPAAFKIRDRVNVHKFVDMLMVDTVPPQEMLYTVLQALKHRHIVPRDTVLDFINMMLKRAMTALACLTEENLGHWYSDTEREDIKQDYREKVIKAIPEIKSLLVCWDNATSLGSEVKTLEPENDGSRVTDVAFVSPLQHMIKIQQTLCLYQDLMPTVLVDDPVIIYKLLGGVKKLSQTSNTDLVKSKTDEVMMETNDGGNQSEKVNDNSDQSVTANGDNDQSEKSTETSVKADLNTFDHMLPQLYLLKLLSRTDARKLPWGKDSQDGHSLMYILLEIMMEVSSLCQTHLTVTTRDLISQLLYSTGLFEYHQGELQLWIRQFNLSIKNLTTNEDKIDVIKLLTHVFTTFIKNPYPYVDKVSDFVSEAITMETTGGSNLDNISVGTHDSIIDGILDMDEDMEPESTCESVATAVDVQDDAFRFPYSPMVVIALEHLTKAESTPSSVTNYMSGIVLDLFHSQIQPLPLVCMLNSCHGNQLDSEVIKYILSWLPSEKLQKLKVPKKGVQMLSSRPLMQAYIRMCVKSAEVQVSELTKSLGDLDVEDMLLVARQLLLYVVTVEKTCSKMGSKSSDVLEVLLETLNELMQLCTRRQDIVPKECDDQLKGSLDLLHDLGQDSRTEPLFEMLQTVLTHPVLLRWFLYNPADKLEDPAYPAKTASCLRYLVTSHMSQFFLSIEKQNLSDLTLVLNRYVDKIKDFMNSIKTGNEPSSTYQELVGMIQNNLGLFTKFLDKEAQFSLLHTVLYLPRTLLINLSSELSPLGNFLMNLLAEIHSNLTVHHNSLALLHIQDFEVLVDIMCSIDSSTLDINCQNLLQSFPHFSVAITKANIWHLLNSSSDVQQKIAMTVIEHNSMARSHLEDWIMETNLTSDKKFWNLPLLTTYLQCVLYRKVVKTEVVNKIYRVYEDCVGGLMDTSVQRPQITGHLCELVILLCKLRVIDGDKQKDISRSITTAIKAKKTIKKDHIRVLCYLSSSTPEGSSGPVVTEAQVYYTCRRCLMYTLQKKERLDGDIDIYLLDLMSKTSQDVIQQLKPSELQKDFSSFVKVCLRSRYSFTNTHKILNTLVKAVYANGTELDLTPSMIFNMVLSHSAFLSIILHEERSEVKECLVDLLITLVELSPQCCDSGHIGIYLGAYRATLSQTDQKLLKLLHLYDKNEVSMKEYKPYLWGPKASEQHSIRKSMGSSLWKQPSTDQVLEYIDHDRLQRSFLKFPLLRKLQPGLLQDLSVYGVDDDLYDPCFILPLFSSLLSPESYVDCRKFAETLCLGYTIAALSCHDSGVRGVAYHVLARYLHHIEGARFPEQQQILYLVTLIRDSVTRPNSKLACIITIFLARMVSLMFVHDDHMYKVMNYFLLLKPAMDISTVPEFYKLFNSSAFEFKVERSWILNLCKDGLRETLDYKLFESRYVFKLLLSFHDSGISDNSTQLQVLNILKSASVQRTMTFYLVKQHGILSWLTGVIASNIGVSKLDVISDILSSLWFSMVRHRSIKGNNSEIDKDGQVTKCLPLAISREMLTCLLYLVKCCGEETNRQVYAKCLETLVSVLNHLKDSVELLKDKGHVCVTPLTTQDVCCILLNSARIVKDRVTETTCTEAFKLLNLKTSQAGSKGMSRQDGKYKTGQKAIIEKEVVEEKTDDNRSEGNDTDKKVGPLSVDLLLHWQPSLLVSCHPSSDGFQVTCSVAMAAISFLVTSLPFVSSKTLVSVVDWIHQHFKKGSNLDKHLRDSEKHQFVRCLVQIYNVLYSVSRSTQSGDKIDVDSDSGTTESVKPYLNGMLVNMNELMGDIASREEGEMSTVWKDFFSNLDTEGLCVEDVSVEVRRYFLGWPSPGDNLDSKSQKMAVKSSKNKQKKKKKTAKA
ncbi:nucleolar pre-ribosomal-associated protein 1-like [Mizuhopecten yessoensis]|uniref:Nucleolar pre-ribosomal-associated protein 1 n=1 Tax=Mizuhopecten yessoensis TaxID=6573 RepID=A0A210QFD3_MIZYE|nr:nucleolar pre-ribosomal-associated protein 1-like [Mizuhopecten yessoensis]OWF47467.1 Nucleolar pre-ribosomal-associated protein 1 [Mizuhopecten yessoensis]